MTKKIPDPFFLLIAVAVMGASHAIVAQPSSDEARRVADASTVLEEIMEAADSSVPSTIMEKAEGIAVFPSLIKGGIIVGAQRGRGVLSVRDKKSGGWSSPNVTLCATKTTTPSGCRHAAH